jgi:protein tyrosine/serine phosphatase
MSKHLRISGPVVLCLLLGLLAPAPRLRAGEPARPRPAEWAQPVTNSTLGNFFQVSAELYRSKQVDPKHIPDLKRLGIRTILDLRYNHEDSKKFEAAGFTLVRYPLKAGSVTAQDLKTILRQVRAVPKPVLVHCWHGSDRTGFVVAGYRITQQNWTKEKAIDELCNGGFGFHARFYPNIVRTLQEADLPPE